MVYAPAPLVCKRYGVTGMTLWRWLQDKKLGFPKPMYINRRRYFAVDDLDAFDQRRAASPLAAGGPPVCPEAGIS